MKATITEVKFNKEFTSKFGVLYSFYIKYDGKTAMYSSKYKEQKVFVPGQEIEFTEELKTYVDKEGNTKEYTVIKPPTKGGQSNFGKALTREKTKYSGFAVSYAKDLLVAGRINKDELADQAWILFELMVAMDKTLES